MNQQGPELAVTEDLAEVRESGPMNSEFTTETERPGKAKIKSMWGKAFIAKS